MVCSGQGKGVALGGRLRFDGVAAGVALMLAALCLAGFPLVSLAQTSPLPFCYQKQTGGQQCFDTLELAEQAMRAAPENAAIASLLEPDRPTLFPLSGTAEYVYRVKDQSAPSVFGPSYIEQNSSNGIVSGMHGCTPGSDPNLPSACLDEQQLAENVVQELRAARPDCSHSGPVLAAERIPPYKEVRHRNNIVFGSTYGEVDYGPRLYNATLRDLRNLEDEYDQKCRPMACEALGNQPHAIG